MTNTVRILVGDVLERIHDLPDQSVQCCVTSPPYWGLRTYHGDDGMIGMERTWDEHLDNLLAVFEAVKRVLRDDGILVVNYGDAYTGSNGGHKNDVNPGLSRSFKRGCPPTQQAPKGALNLPPKNLMMMPARLAIAMQERGGWILRSEVVWAKKNCMPESVLDRPTSSHEKVFVFAKRPKYYWDAVAVRTPAKSIGNPRGRTTYGRHTLGEAIPEKQRRADKPRGHTRRHDGFNDRWDAMSKDEQQAGGGNMRNVLHLATKPFSKSHFATFPPDLIRPFVLAGTSEAGQCPHCGTPWERIVERGDVIQTGIAMKAVARESGFDDRRDIGNVMRVHALHTRGWQPTCGCAEHEPVPQTLLDCFGGAGTTGMVAAQEGRDAVLCEISPDYADMAAQRIEEDGGMHVSVTMSGAPAASA